ncbi:MAG: 4-hydroxy-tetrahydrodipicolinate reductase [Candidatus Omnitrophota bacterium]
MVRIGISGVCGRMGKRIACLALSDPEFQITCALEKKETGCVGKSLGKILEKEGASLVITSDLRKVRADIDCLIDFTLPEASLNHLEICRENNISMVIGTTGFDSHGESKIQRASKDIPIVFSPNMAIGVNLVFSIVSQAARVLGRDFSVKIDETHHARKKDSPSGTAKKIRDTIKTAAGIEAPIEAFREGEVIGNHGIIFDGMYETIEIRHNAKSRDVFAAGALKAAKFLSGKQPGLYDMSDVLGLK